MKYGLARMSIFIGCICLVSASSLAQHASPGAHPPQPSSAPPPAALADAKIEFENEAIIVMRVRMAPHEKTPMHDITSARLVCGLPTPTCATRIPTAARMRRIGARGKSIGSACNGTRERISRTKRWNFWRSCQREGVG